jgi:hypothetical protein
MELLLAQVVQVVAAVVLVVVLVAQAAQETHLQLPLLKEMPVEQALLALMDHLLMVQVVVVVLVQQDKQEQLPLLALVERVLHHRLLVHQLHAQAAVVVVQ